MALSIGFRILSFLPSCYSSCGALNFYPDGTFTHCSCQPSLDAHFPFPIRAACLIPVAEEFEIQEGVTTQVEATETMSGVTTRVNRANSLAFRRGSSDRMKSFVLK